MTGFFVFTHVETRHGTSLQNTLLCLFACLNQQIQHLDC